MRRENILLSNNEDTSNLGTKRYTDSKGEELKSKLGSPKYMTIPGPTIGGDPGTKPASEILRGMIASGKMDYLLDHLNRAIKYGKVDKLAVPYPGMVFGDPYLYD